jgi:hypothetical protein
MDNSIGLAPKVRLGDWIGEGWNMFAAQWKVWVLNALVLFGVVFVPIAAMVGMVFVLAPAAGSFGGGLPFIAMLLMMFVVVITALAQVFLVAGMYKCAFKQLRGEPISTADMFSGGDKVLPILGAGILIGILTMIGFVLCIIPAFIVAGALYFTIPLIVERDMGVIDAMSTSRDATRGDLLMFVLFAFLVALIAQAGGYACYVGLLVTMPLQYTIAAVAFRDCFGVPGARSFSSNPAAQQDYGAPPLLPSYRPDPWQAKRYQDQGTAQPPVPPLTYQPAPPSPGPAQSPGWSPPIAPPPSAVPPEASGGQYSSARGPSSQAPGQIVCPSCEAVLPATARFCARCGRGLTSPS